MAEGLELGKWLGRRPKEDETREGLYWAVVWADGKVAPQAHQRWTWESWETVVDAAPASSADHADGLVSEREAAWDGAFVEVARLDDLGPEGSGLVRERLEAFEAPEGREVVVLYGLDGGAPWLCGPGLLTHDDYYAEAVGEEGDLGDSRVSVRIGHSPLGWLDTLHEFDGF